MTPATSARIIRALLAAPYPGESDTRAIHNQARRERAAALRAEGDRQHATHGYARAVELFAQADEIDPWGAAR